MAVALIFLLSFFLSSQELIARPVHEVTPANSRKLNPIDPQEASYDDILKCLKPLQAHFDAHHRVVFELRDGTTVLVTPREKWIIPVGKLSPQFRYSLPDDPGSFLVLKGEFGGPRLIDNAKTGPRFLSPCEFGIEPGAWQNVRK